MALLLFCFGLGFYLAELYSQISALIEQRRAALTSAIYSSPTVLRVGDDIERARLLDRLAHLSYTAAATVINPGQYSEGKGALTIYIRPFKAGLRDYPATLVHLSLRGTEIVGVADAFGLPLQDAVVEPEIIGRLMPEAPAERIEVSLSELPPFLVPGLLATEDRFFYYHFGFNPVRMVEAALADLRAHRFVQGASTITQQLARTFILRQRRNLWRKTQELAIALVLEMRLSKDEILERYVNDVPMGDFHGAPIYGVPLAARYFFNKGIGEITPAEAATLIGMIRATTIYDPRRHPEACQARRNDVLAVMLRARVIDAAAYEQARSTPLTIRMPPGLRRAPYFTDYVTAQVERLPGVAGHLQGLKVYTTLDTEAQAAAETAVARNLSRIEQAHRGLARLGPDKALQSALVAIDVSNGAIRALIGGRNYGASQFNRAVMAERQPGSAFKPIVYLAALAPELSPLHPPLTLASVLPDRPMSFGGWIPANYERTYRGQVTVAAALIESLNVPTAYVGSLIGAPTMVGAAHVMGIREDMPAVLPISIGTGQATLLELTSAYSVFAAGGIMNPPYAIEAVVDGYGRLIFEQHPSPTRIVSPEASYLITGALEQVLKWGTGASASRMGLGFPAAGKTGTSEDYHDAYFIGYTPRIACGVWVGFDEPHSIAMSGAQAALPAWVSFMLETASGLAEDFPAPPGITMATIDPSSGGLATPSCPRAVALPFITGTAPTDLCPLHGGLLAAPASVANLVGSGPAPAPGAPAAPRAKTEGILGAIGNFFAALFSP